MLKKKKKIRKYSGGGAALVPAGSSTPATGGASNISAFQSFINTGTGTSANNYGFSPTMLSPLLGGVVEAKNTRITPDNSTAKSKSQAISQGVIDASKQLPGTSGYIAQGGDATAKVTRSLWKDKNLGEEVYVPTQGEAITTGAISRGASGAAIGNTIAPGGVGAAIGGGVGLIYGGIEGGLTQKKQEKAGNEKVKEIRTKRRDKFNTDSNLFYSGLKDQNRNNIAYAKNGLKFNKTIMNNRMKYADGGNMMQAPAGVGGVPQGPTHEEGGMPVIDPNTGEPVAEIEGNERIFSREDTAMMDELGAAMLQAQQDGDEESFNQMATELGIFIFEAMIAQEEAQMKEEEGEDMPIDEEMLPEDIITSANQF